MRSNHYSSQRMNRSSRPNTRESQASGSSKGRRASYTEPSNFENLDELAVPQPVQNTEDNPTYRRQSGLEDNIREARVGPNSKETKQSRSRDRGDRVPQRRSARHGSEDLTEVAAPPPVQTDLDEEQSSSAFGHQRHLEDEEGGEGGSEEASPPFQPKRPEDYAQEEEPSIVPKLLTELYTISYLIFFAILGTLARLGVQWLTFYPGTPVGTPVIWANFGGSLIMGFLAEDQGLFRDPARPDNMPNGQPREKGRRRSKTAEDVEATTKAELAKRKKTIPLYIGLATGFCGSFTSFSSFARDFFLALSNNLPSPVSHPYPAGHAPRTTSTVSRNGGYSFEALLHVVLATLALSIGGLIVGAQIAIFLSPLTPSIPRTFMRKIFDPLMVFLGFGSWLGAVFLAIWPPDRPGGPSSLGSWSNETWRGEVIFALAFAPAGCLLRFYASLKLNGLVPAYPLGTFAVNMLGTAIEGMCYDIQHVGVGIMGRIGGGRVGCQVLQGVMDGFCGCLTTVSTWVAEINGLKRKHGWGYAFGSILGGLCLMVVIMGSVRWSVGWSDPVCNTGYTSKIHG